MAEKRKRSKYQLKLRFRKALANKIGGAIHSGAEGKRLPFALPVLLAMKAEKEAGLLEDTEEEEQEFKNELAKDYVEDNIPPFDEDMGDNEPEDCGVDYPLYDDELAKQEGWEK